MCTNCVFGGVNDNTHLANPLVKYHIIRSRTKKYNYLVLPMPCPLQTRSWALNIIFQQAAERERVSASRTPLIAVVVAITTHRLP